MKGQDPGSDEWVERPTDENAPFAALVFKIVADPYVGRLAYFRVYSGKLQTGVYTLNSTKNKKERIGRLLQMHANHREDIQEVYAGDIAAIVGLKDTFTGDTLCDPTDPIVLESIKFPEPVISIAVEPKTKIDQDKMDNALVRLAEEDPTFKVKTDPDSGQVIISGMGELHLEVILDRMFREYKVEANRGRPQVAYKETITQPVRARGLFKRQSGGRGMFGDATVEFEPMRARWRLRVRQQGRRRRDPQGIHPCRWQGYPEEDGVGWTRRLPCGGHPCHPGGRLVPRSGLQRNGLRDRRLDGSSGRLWRRVAP